MSALTPPRPRRGVRVQAQTSPTGTRYHVAVCACGWIGERHVVKAAAEEEARWHRATHRKEHA